MRPSVIGPRAERQHLGDAILRAAQVLPRARELVEVGGDHRERGADLEREQERAEAQAAGRDEVRAERQH